jgi:hypothetical protein
VTPTSPPLLQPPRSARTTTTGSATSARRARAKTLRAGARARQTSRCRAGAAPRSGRGDSLLGAAACRQQVRPRPDRGRPGPGSRDLGRQGPGSRDLGRQGPRRSARRRPGRSARRRTWHRSHALGRTVGPHQVPLPGWIKIPRSGRRDQLATRAPSLPGTRVVLRLGRGMPAPGGPMTRTAASIRLIRGSGLAPMRCTRHRSGSCAGTRSPGSGKPSPASSSSSHDADLVRRAVQLVPVSARRAPVLQVSVTAERQAGLLTGARDAIRGPAAACAARICPAHGWPMSRRPARSGALAGFASAGSPARARLEPPVGSKDRVDNRRHVPTGR